MYKKDLVTSELQTPWHEFPGWS